MAALGLLAGTFVAIAPAAQAAPGDATITATPNTGLNTTQLISVSGNAGPLSTDNNGAAPGGVPDTSYPFLYISMCRLPLTASSCDTDLGNGIASSTDTDPTTAPHVVRVQPDASGNWGPINILARKTIVNGDGRFQCGTGANQCVIGSANAPRPSDHSYDATQNLSFAAPSLSYATVNADLATTTVTGTNLQMQTLGTGDPTPTTQNIYVFQCAVPVGPSTCDGNPANYANATVDKYGSFTAAGVTVRRNFTDQGSVARDCAVITCIFATIKNPPGAPDNFSAYGTTPVLVIPAVANITSITGQTVTTAARAGNTVNISGNTWTPSGAITVELCTTALTGCAASQFTSNTLVVDGAGLLTGGAVVDASATTGARAIKLSQVSGKTVSLTITILGTPTLAGAPASGGAGTSVSMSGTNWNPGSTVVLQGRTSVPGDSSDAAVNLTVAGDGSISGNYVVNDPATTSIQGTSGALSGSVPFSFSGNSCNVPTGSNCALQQNVHFLANPGQLNQTQAGGDVDLGALTLNGLVQNLTGAINQDVITDARGTSAGWTLNAKLTNLTNNGGSPTVNGTIPAANMAWTPACAVTSGGAAPTTGSGATLLNADQLFCSVPAGTGNGVYTADAGLNLTVPATADAGTYNAILTLTLS